MYNAEGKLSSDELIVEYTSLAYSIAYSYRDRGVPLEDLQQEALLGILAAANHYREDCGAKFSTYATYWIKKYVIQAIAAECGISSQTVELDAMPVPDAVMPSVQSSAEVSEALSLPSDMPDLEKEVITLCFQEQLSIKEIGIKLGISNEKVKQIRQKAMRRLRSTVHKPL